MKLFNLFSSVLLCVQGALAGPFAVPVYVTALYDQGTGEGRYPDSVILQEINVINSFYQPIGLTFRLAQAPARVGVSAAQFNGWNDKTKLDVSARFGKRNPQALNVFTAGKSANAVAFLSAFPMDYSRNQVGDAIMIDYHYLPGGSALGFNSGKMLATAVGHWLGLYSTYQGGCATPGDFVDDTPAQASPASGCPRGRDTCPGGGLDPIDNLMSGADDNCRVRLTTGQYNRIAQQIAQYRGINLH